MKRNLSLTLLFAIFLTACGASATPTLAPATEAPTLAPTAVPPTATPEPAPQTLTVFAAASLTDAFTEIGAAFDAANPGVTTTFNFAGSQALRTQIEEGAPVDVFASASGKEMETLVTGSFVGADGEAGVLCCTPVKPAERVVVLRAKVLQSDGSYMERGTATVRVRDVGTNGSAVIVERWDVR